MYLKTENLNQLVQGTELNNYQRALAKKEFERLLNLVKEMEGQLALHNVVKKER